MQKDYDVVVVGAGPAGLLTAREASKGGCRTLVLEEHEEIGKPERCAGLFSISGLRMIDVPLSQCYIQNTVRGAIFKSPSGRVFELDAGKDVAVVSNREMFDKYLATMAMASGAEILTNSKVLSINIGQEIHVNTKDIGILADIVIDAEGSIGLLARKIWRSYKPNGWIPIVHAVIKNHRLDRRYVYLYFKDYLKDFFGYMVPIDDELGKVGVASRKHTLELFLRFLEEEFSNSKELSRIGAMIYLGKPMWLLSDHRVLAVGDVSGHVKATTGGGVIFGGLSAIQTGRFASKFIMSGEGFDEYVYQMKRIYSKLSSIYRIRCMMRALPSHAYDTIFKVAKDSGLDSWLADRGDMDMQDETLRSFLCSRKAFAFAFKLILQILKDLF